MPKLTVNNDALKGFTPLPAGIYTFKFEGMKPKMAKSGDSVNYNPILKIVGGEYDGRVIFYSLNSKGEWVIQDFVHALGFEMIKTSEKESEMPGEFDGDANKMDTWVYRGPLQNATGQFELVATTYQGKPKNDIKQFICKVPGCATKNPDVSHSTNLIK